MINWSAIPQEAFIGKWLRRFLRAAVPRRAVLPILQGPLRGTKWIVGSGVLGYWLGSYERAEQEAFADRIAPGDTVFDVGAHVGFYTLIASLLVGPRGRVFAFEPSPRNLGYLERHVALNRAANVTVCPVAVGGAEGIARFSEGGNSSIGAITAGEGIAVPLTTLDAFSRARGAVPRLVKMDIEGGEFEALRGARELLCKRHPTIILGTHSDDLFRSCVDFLRSLGYTTTPLRGPGVEANRDLVAFFPS